jgi:hypothetical protein
MPQQDWTSIFRELTATLQSLEGCDTNTTMPPQSPREQGLARL